MVNTISSFGRVISWVDDECHLARILVRARVIDYDQVPQFLVLTDGEGFQGESWTVQCEVLHGRLLGGLPQDEDPALGNDDFPLGGPFDLFGFGQPANGPGFHQNAMGGAFQDAAAQGGIPGHGFENAEMAQNVADQVDVVQGNANNMVQDEEPILGLQVDADAVAPGLDLNGQPANPLDLDLNALVDMQEVIINPVHPAPQPFEAFLELSDLINQDNENEEIQIQENLDPANPLGIQDNLNVNADLDVQLPVLNGPAENFLPLEIHEEDLMNEDEIQQQIEEEEAQGNFIGPRICKWALCLLTTAFSLLWTSLHFLPLPATPWALGPRCLIP